MPLYEYRCDACGAVFEKMQKFSDEPLTVHDDCGGAVHRLISAPAFQFKGTGWYVTDYAKGGKSANNGGGAKDSSASKESKSSTESKPSASSSDSSSPTPSSTPSSSNT